MQKGFVNMVLIMMVYLTGISLKAQDADSLFTSANKFYQQENYLEALDLYKKIEGQGLESWSLYFNMANIYYKTNQVAPSIYYYEKALLLDPNNRDIKFNLEFANRMTLDNIEPLPKSLGQKFMDGIVLKFNYETWAKIAVGLAFLFALLFLLYHFSYSTSKKRFYFITSGLCVIFVTTSVFFAFRNKHYVDNNTQAVVFSNAVAVKSAPTKSSELYFELHEGTKVTVLETLDNWKKIKIADGKMGWLDASSIKEI